MISLINLTILLAFAPIALSSFSNEVIYPEKSRDGIYRFTLEVTEGLTMAYWNSSRKTYQVVVNNNNTFYIRDRRSVTACNALLKVNDSIVDSIVTGAGRHKDMLFVNMSLPGPPIVVPLNARLHITVKNSMMTDALSMHWHGFNQYGTFYMDGVSRVSQCPIGPGDSFIYEFQATELGTHW